MATLRWSQSAAFNATSVVITLPAAPTAGRLFALVVCKKLSSTENDLSVAQTGATWTLAKISQQFSNIEHNLYYCWNATGASSPTITLTVSASARAGSYWITEWSGINVSSNPLVHSNNGANSGVTTVNSSNSLSGGVPSLVLGGAGNVNHAIAPSNYRWAINSVDDGFQTAPTVALQGGAGAGNLTYSTYIYRETASALGHNYRYTLASSDTYTGVIGAFRLSVPTAATDPWPADGAASTPYTFPASWTGDATSFNVYLGTSPGSLSLVDDTVTATLMLSDLSRNTTYYWRVDSVNSVGTTTGTLWSFTTAADARATYSIGYGKLAYNNRTSSADFSRVDGKNIDIDEGFETAVLLSLFSEARASADDGLPIESRGGYWGDAYPSVAGDQFGSRLWLLKRAKATQQNVARAQSYAKESLQWMIDDGIARSVDVVAQLQRPGTLALHVSIARANGAVWKATWEVTLGIR